jgi:hypothetical protein
MKLLFIGLIFMFAHLAFGQKANNQFKPILDTVIIKAKELSLYSNTVNWDSLETKMLRSAENAIKIEDLKPAFEILLNGLRDHHGQIRKTSEYSILAYFSDFQNSRKKDNREKDQEIWNIVNDIDSRFEYQMLPNNIGYLKVVGVGQNVDGQKEAERIRGAIQKLHKKDVDKWIIDLRYNGGGNINVMMAGLAPFFNTQKLISIENRDEEMQGTAEVKKGNFWYYGMNAFKMKNKPKIKNAKIAVLTSRWTVSSGEIIAIAFKGQSNTKSFGEETGGYVTNNCYEVINNEIALIISTGIFCDRNGTRYVQNVRPDVEILFKVEEDISKDLGIGAAIHWLEE